MSRHCVRRLTTSDLPALLDLQSQVLADTLSARLGPSFNRVYHQTMLASDDYLCDGYFVDGVLVGYLSCTADTLGLLRAVLRRNVPALARALLTDLVRAPSKVVLFFRIARSIAFATSEPTIRGAELLSVGVHPAFRGARTGSGPRPVADALLQSALANLRTRGASRVCLVAKPMDVDLVPHRFVRKYGFAPAGSVARFGVHAELYVLTLDAVESSP